jgi:protein-disulfide isomerase
MARWTNILCGAVLATSAWLAAPASADIAAPGGELAEQSFGSEQAPVTVIEYASLTCHHCRDFHVEEWPRIKKAYVDTGKVRFILREFPLDPLATAGFMLARCSGDLRWYSVVDLLYRNDDAWAHVPDPVAGLQGLMSMAGMKPDVFEQCLRNEDLLQKIGNVKARGQKEGVNSTPTFFVNGEKHAGGFTLESFAKLVDPLIAKARP